MSTVEQFWAKVDKSGPIPTAIDATLGHCWTWSGSVDGDGYGILWIFKGRTRAHRASWRMLKGDISDGLVIDHLCFNPPCVNPDHLRLLSVVENSRNQLSARKTHCNYGHEFTPSNTRIQHRPDGATWRACRECQNVKARQRRAAVAS